MTKDFDELVDVEGLSPAEQERLRHVHDLLVATGPPPELSASLEHPPAQPRAEVVSFPLLRSRRAAAALIAAVVAAAAFAGGYLVGDRSDGGGETVRVVRLQGPALSATASVRIGGELAGGNWPMELTVSGLPKQAGRGYYELFVWRRGKPGYPCVGFKMHEGATTVRFTVPYELKASTKLVVTAIVPGKVRWPGKVVMRTV